MNRPRASLIDLEELDPDVPNWMEYRPMQYERASGDFVCDVEAGLVVLGFVWATSGAPWRAVHLRLNMGPCLLRLRPDSSFGVCGYGWTFTSRKTWQPLQQSAQARLGSYGGQGLLGAASLLLATPEAAGEHLSSDGPDLTLPGAVQDGEASFPLWVTASDGDEEVWSTLEGVPIDWPAVSIRQTEADSIMAPWAIWRLRGLLYDLQEPATLRYLNGQGLSYLQEFVRLPAGKGVVLLDREPLIRAPNTARVELDRSVVMGEECSFLGTQARDSVFDGPVLDGFVLPLHGDPDDPEAL